MAAKILGLVPTKIEPTSRERAQNGAIREILERIKGDESLHGQNFKITSWEQRSSASGALYSLKGAYGEDETCGGFKMGVHPDGEGEGEDFKPNGSWVLIVRYTPDAIVPGNLEKSREDFKRREKIKADKYAKNKAEKEAAAANGGGAEAGPVPVAPTTTSAAGENAEPVVAGANPTAEQTAKANAEKAKAAVKAKVAST